MSKDIPRLGGGLIMRKGEAVPTPPIAVAAPTPEAPTPPQPRRKAQPIEADAAPIPKGMAGTIAVTVRLDPARYERMKMHGARQRRSNQEILVAALDAYLTQRDDAPNAS